MSFGKFARRLEGVSIRREISQWSAFFMCIVVCFVVPVFYGYETWSAALRENSG